MKVAFILATIPPTQAEAKVNGLHHQHQSEQDGVVDFNPTDHTHAKAGVKVGGVLRIHCLVGGAENLVEFVLSGNRHSFLWNAETNPKSVAGIGV